MPENSSSCASADADTFFPSVMSDQKCLAAFRRAIYGHPTMAWAKVRCLEDDLEQIALIEVAKIIKTYNPERGTTVEQYVGVALRKRMYSAYTSLANAYFDDSPFALENFGNAENAANADETNLNLEADIIVLNAGIEDPHDEQHDQSAAVPNRARSRELGSDDLNDRVHHEFSWLYAGSRGMSDDPQLSLETARNSSVLATQIKLLPIRQREVLNRTLAAQTNREIARSLGVTVQSIGQTRDAALIKLTTAVSEWETIH